VDVGLVGSGKGELIADGTQVTLQWSRASVREATQVFFEALRDTLAK